MESILNMIVNAENVRMLLVVVFGFSGFMLIKASIKDLRRDMEVSIKELRGDMETSIKGLRGDMEASIKGLRGDMEASIKGLRGDMETSIKGLRGDMETSINGLKYNDIAHLNSSIEALTYALEKNGYLKKEDKEFVDSRLAH